MIVGKEEGKTKGIRDWKESELLEKYKKSNTELSVQKVSVESSYSDMTEKMKALSEDRNLLERQVIHLRVRKYV